MSQYLNPFPQHTNSDGNPNAFYKVYFGEPNQDPIANPKAPFSDKALQVPLSPVQVLNATGAYQQDIFLDGAYSIRIETELGSLWRETPSFEGLASSLFVDNFVVSTMISDVTLTIGDFVQTVGYTAAGDGGDNVYEIVAAGTGVDDGGLFIDLSTHQAKGLFPGGISSVTQWGAVGTSDDTAAILNAITGVGVGGSLFFPKRVYIVSGTGTILTQLSGQTWYGAGKDSSIVRMSDGNPSFKTMVVTEDDAENYSFNNMQFDGNRDNITPASDLYNNYRLIRGPSGGRNGNYKSLILANSWGRTLETGDESGVVTNEVTVNDVEVINSGTKGIVIHNCSQATVIDCHSEVNAYTAAENTATGVGATSGSCLESAGSTNVLFMGNHGTQINATQQAPGIRIINGGSLVVAIGNTIEGATYLGFIQNTNDVRFTNNLGRNLTSNGILIADSDAGEPTVTCLRIFVSENTIIDPAGVYILISASKAGFNVFVECYIHDNNFVQIAASPTGGINNSGVIAPAIGGSCEVYEWNNIYTGNIPNRLSGPASDEIRPKPDSGWRIIGQSSVAVTHTGNTSETDLATVTIPADFMGANGRLRITALWSYANNANNKTARIRFSGNEVYSSVNTTTTQNRAQAEIGNRNDTALQITSMLGSDSGFGVSTSAVNLLTVNTTNDRDVTITGELANAADTIILRSYIVELFKEI